MTKVKKTLAMLLCLAMCLSLLPTWALAEEITEPADNVNAELLQEEQIQEEVYEEPAENNEEFPAEDTETEAAVEDVNVPDPAEEIEVEVADQGEEVSTEKAGVANQGEETGIEEAGTEPESAEVVEQTEGSEVSSTDTAEEPVANRDAEEKTPVTVVFNVTPEDAVVTVYTKDNPDDPEEKTVIDPEEDGSYLLLPGEYYYDVVAEEYRILKEEKLTVKLSKSILEIKANLQVLGEENSLIQDGKKGISEELPEASLMAANGYTINGKTVHYNDVSSSPNECWAYANSIYKIIWGSNFSNEFSSSDNLLRNLSDSDLTLTAAHLKAYVSEAALGSCLRICNSEYLHGTDGWGHSQIIVQKDANGFTVFQGGLSNSPYCNEQYYTWDGYINTGWLGGQYQYIKYIKWPGTHNYSSNYLDINGIIDGVSKDHISDAGEVDVYINGNLDARNVADYYTAWPTGTTYEIKNIRGYGYEYNGASDALSGTIGNANKTIVLSFSKMPESAEAAKSMVYNGHRYERYDYHLTWTEAKAFCENKGGHLACITDANEQTAVVGLLNGCPFGVYYIGAYDLNQSGNWSWVNGDRFVYENWDKDYLEPTKGEGEYYNAIIGQENPPSKQVGDWIDCPNEVAEGFYSKNNCGFICEYPEQIETYTISYNANGGNNAPASQTKYSGETVYLSTTTPTRNCHVFKGWATSPNATTAQYQAREAYSEDANLTLYAVWSEGTYTEWSTTEPSGIEQSRIESIAQFRYSYKEFTTDTVAEKEGWTLDSSDTVWSDYGPWSGWSTTKVNASDSVKVETRTAYSYYYFVCSKCGAHMHGSGTCYSWAGGCGASGTVSSGSYQQVWLTTPYSNSSDFHGTGVNYITSSDGTVFAYTSTSSPHYVAPTTQYRSCTRTQSTVYTFYRWGEWSDWTVSYYPTTDQRKSEIRMVYRYLLDGNEAHSWDNGTVLKAATCTEDGSIQYTCLKCGKTRTEVLGKLGHQYTETVTAPTCTERGYTTFYCAGCGDSYIDNYVNALGHSWNAGVITKAASCTAAGTMTYTCSRCGETKTETISATGHVWGAWTVTKAATCTANGTETRYCTNDISHTETRDITALGHNYVNGYCSRCGEKDPQASVTIRYDANGGTGAPAIQTVSLGETVKLSDAKPTKEGAAFLGWATSANATTAAYQPGGDFKANADTILYAVWKTGTYTISFDANGGTRAPDAQIKDHGTALVLSEQEPVRTGYTFQGWSIEKDSDYIDYHPGETYLADKDATLYAVWTVKTYDVRYNANGGSRAPATQTKTHGVDLKLSDKEPVRDGYEFQGWAKTQNTEYVDFYPGDLYRTEADVTLYAVWNASSSTVTVSLKKTSLTLAADGSDTLKAETSAPNAELVWSSSNEAVATVDHNGKVTGHSVGTAVITVMVKGSGSSAECEVNVLFRDVVKMTDYFYEPVYWAVENGITSGTSATTFSPYNACTRAQVMSFLWKANGSPIVGGSNPFTDVKTSDYFYKPVLWAVSQGITNGTTATTFSPYNTCTRAQVMAFLYKAKGSPEVSGSNPFTDVKESDYFYKPVLWAVANGITNGTSATTFAPYNTCTRAQVMTFLYKAMN